MGSVLRLAPLLAVAELLCCACLRLLCFGQLPCGAYTVETHHITDVHAGPHFDLPASLACHTSDRLTSCCHDSRNYTNYQSLSIPLLLSRNNPFPRGCFRFCYPGTGYALPSGWLADSRGRVPPSLPDGIQHVLGQSKIFCTIIVNTYPS
jgi:hypothetical protein